MILMYFRVKKTLKYNRYYTFKHSLHTIFLIYQMTTTFIIIFNKFHSVFFFKMEPIFIYFKVVWESV